ncbi:MAG: acyl-CoA dehydrogenase family protein [Gammaproteobacteria bacterium]|nr:acyl-CoA dehydrogenase family protein [Gammaproteobacteria bacterium]
MPQNSAPASTDSAIPTPAELAAAAESLAPLVRANAVLAEELRDPVPEVVDALRKAGLHKLYRPRRFGGYGLDWGPHFTVSERLARECGSTGWLVSLVFSHVMYLGRFPLEAQEEFFASAGDDAVLASGSAGGGVIRRDGSDWQLKGRWAFVSGVNVASGVMVTAREDSGGPISHFAILLPGEYQVLDTWHVEGLRGTGSHDVVVDPVLVPARRGLTLDEFASMSPPGAAIAESYVHRVRTWPYQTSWLVGPLLGTARGALESYCEQTRGRTGRLFGESIVSQVPVQVRVGESCARLDAAELLFEKVIRVLHAAGAAGEEIAGERLLRLRRLMTFGSRLCTSTADSLAAMMGVTGQKASNPVQRLYRDCRAISTHIELNWDQSMAPTGKVRLGVPTGDPLIDGGTTSADASPVLGKQI